MSTPATHATDGTDPDEPSPLTASAVFDLLSNPRRQAVLQYLRDREEASMRALSRHIAAWENGVDLAEVTSTQRKRVYTALHQTHLTRLDEYGVVEYDRDRGLVRATERIGVFEPYLDGTADGDGPWATYYLGVAVGGLVVGLGIVANVPLLGAVPAGVPALVIGLAVTALAVHQHSRHSARPRFPDLRPDVPDGDGAEAGSASTR